MTAKQWKARVTAVGCIVCVHFEMGQTPANLHHVRRGQGKGQRASDWLVIPLCREHHQGKTGVHGSEFYTRWKADEMDLLAWTLEQAL